MFGFVKYGGILLVDKWLELEFPQDNIVKAVLSVKKYDEEQKKAVKTDKYEYIYGVEYIDVIYRNVLSGDALWYTEASIKVFGTKVAEFTALVLIGIIRRRKKYNLFCGALLIDFGTSAGKI